MQIFDDFGARHNPSNDFFIEENGFIRDHQSVSDHRVALIRAAGLLKIYSFNTKTQNSKLIAESSTFLSEEEKEQFWQLAVCPKGQFFAVFVISCIDWPFNASRLIIFELTDNGFEAKDQIDLSEEGFEDMQSMCFYGYYQNSLILTAMAHSEPNALLTFEYNLKSEKLREVNELRKGVTTEVGFCQMLRVGEELVSCNFDAQMLKIKYNF